MVNHPATHGNAMRVVYQYASKTRGVPHHVHSGDEAWKYVEMENGNHPFPMNNL